MVLWPEASNNGNCFWSEREKEVFIGQFEVEAKAMQINYHFCLLHAFSLYWSNTVETRRKMKKKLFHERTERNETSFWKKLSALNWYFFLKHPIRWQPNYFKASKFFRHIFWLKCFKFQVPRSIHSFVRRLVFVGLTRVNGFFELPIWISRWCFAIFICFYCVWNRRRLKCDEIGFIGCSTRWSFIDC